MPTRDAIERELPVTKMAKFKTERHDRYQLWHVFLSYEINIKARGKRIPSNVTASKYAPNVCPWHMCMAKCIASPIATTLRERHDRRAHNLFHSKICTV